MINIFDYTVKPMAIHVYLEGQNRGPIRDPCIRAHEKLVTPLVTNTILRTYKSIFGKKENNIISYNILLER